MIKNKPQHYSYIKSYLLLFILLFSYSCKNLKTSSNGWVTIFNGKDFNGWSIQSLEKLKAKSFWKIEDGHIHCITNGNKNHTGSWLVFDKNLEDFEFKFKFKSNGKLRGNSGLQIRSLLDLSINKMQGPQIDIHPPKPFRTGLLYGETEGVQHWLFPKTETWRLESYPLADNWTYFEDDWNELYVKCQGTKIITKLNGVLITDFNGNGILNDNLHKNLGVGLNGLLSFQLHKKHDIDIQFTDIKLKRLK